MWDGWGLLEELLAQLLEMTSVLAVEDLGYKEPVQIPRPPRIERAYGRTTSSGNRLALVREVEDESQLDPNYSEAVTRALAGFRGGG